MQPVGRNADPRSRRIRARWLKEGNESTLQLADEWRSPSDSPDRSEGHEDEASGHVFLSRH
jgi:hypothetical protein